MSKILNSRTLSLNVANGNSQVSVKNLTTNRYNRITPLYVQIPKSYYMVDSVNRNFATLTETTGGATGILTFSTGTFNQTDFAIQLKTSLEAIGSHTYTITYIDEYNQWSIVSSDPGGWTLTNINSDFQKYLGSTSATATSTASTWDSTGTINFQRYESLLVHCGFVNNYGSDILIDVPVSDTPYWSDVIIEPGEPDYYKSEATNTNSQNVFCFITDENGANINFHGENVSLRICLYQE